MKYSVNISYWLRFPWPSFYFLNGYIETCSTNRRERNKSTEDVRDIITHFGSECVARYLTVRLYSVYFGESDNCESVLVQWFNQICHLYFKSFIAAIKYNGSIFITFSHKIIGIHFHNNLHLQCWITISIRTLKKIKSSKVNCTLICSCVQFAETKCCNHNNSSLLLPFIIYMCY